MCVQYLLRTVARDGCRAMTGRLPPASAYRPVPDPVSGAEVVVSEDRDGALMAVDAWIEVLVRPGEFVGHGAPVARIHRPPAATDADRATVGCSLIGPERSLVQDPGFALRRLVDVGRRALSPPVNDPTTAVRVIDHITDLLSRAADRPDRPGWYAGPDGVGRVRFPRVTFDDLARLGFIEITVPGAGSPQVVRRLRAAYAFLGERCDAARRGVVAGRRARLDRAVSDGLGAAFIDAAAVVDPRGFG